MRLIDADALPEHKFPENQCNKFGDGAYYRQGWNDAIDAIVDNQPPVDAVPVQRCDGCRYADWHSNGCIAYCTKHGTDGHVADSFCSEGEKDGEAHD